MKQLLLISTFCGFFLWLGLNQLGRYLALPKETRLLNRQISDFKTSISRVEATDLSQRSLEQELELAKSKLELGFMEKSPEGIMAGLKEYKAVLERSPENPEALQALAKTSVRIGILDQAIGFYERYLEIKPEDKLTHVDYVLALLQAGNSQLARVEIDQIVAEDPSFYPALVANALVYRGEEKFAEAIREITKSLDYAPEDKKKSIEAIRAKFQQEYREFETEVNAPVETRLERFFKAHSIIGPKLEKLEWPKQGRLIVYVKDFPVEAMPVVAKDLLAAKVKEVVGSSGATVTLNDSQTKKILLTF
ncbi:hypothetical protein JNK13_06350 [bacterium]|nr:hypothetical protein [bacterium]